MLKSVSPSWLKTFSTVCDPKPLFSNWPVQCVFLYVATPAAVMSHMFLRGHAAQMWSDCCCQHSDFHASSILHIKTSLFMRSQSPANVTCFIAAFIWLTVSTRIHFLTSVLWCRVSLVSVSSADLHAACQQLELRVCVFVQVILCLWFWKQIEASLCKVCKGSAEVCVCRGKTMVFEMCCFVAV